MRVDSYSFGSMTVNGRTYTSDLIVFPDKVKSGWWRAEGHVLSMEDLKDVIAYKPEVLVVGKGASGCMEIPLSTREALKAENIEIVDRNTDEAYILFNEEIRKGKRAVGAFHLTC
jgi:hypothetical protein